MGSLRILRRSCAKEKTLLDCTNHFLHSDYSDHCIGPRHRFRQRDRGVFDGQSAEPPGQSGISVPAQTFSGVITDAHCGAKHKLADKSPAECTRICVKNGSTYVLVNGDKMYALHGDIVELNRVAGERVTITGSLAGNRINITSISDGQ